MPNDKGAKMELKEVIKNRKSIREYEDTPIKEDKLLRVLEAARLAPSGLIARHGNLSS